MLLVGDESVDVVKRVGGIVRRLGAELGTETIVIATGRLAGALVPFVQETIDEVDELLTVVGLRLIWKRRDDGLGGPPVGGSVAVGGGGEDLAAGGAFGEAAGAVSGGADGAVPEEAVAVGVRGARRDLGAVEQDRAAILAECGRL
jgi:hypothetical protein